MVAKQIISMSKQLVSKGATAIKKSKNLNR